MAFDLFDPFLPTRAGNQYVEVATDLFCKYVQLRAVKSAKAEESALTLHQWVTKNSAPTKMLSDRGTDYTGKVLKETVRLLNVEKVYTTAGHKETNGQAERLVKTSVGMMVALWQQDLQGREPRPVRVRTQRVVQPRRPERPLRALVRARSDAAGGTRRSRGSPRWSSRRRWRP